MTKIEIQLKLRVEVDPNVTLQSVHNSFKEWIEASNLHYQIQGQETAVPFELMEIESSSENLSYITLTRYDKDRKEENHIKTKIHV